MKSLLLLCATGMIISAGTALAQAIPPGIPSFGCPTSPNPNTFSFTEPTGGSFEHETFSLSALSSTCGVTEGVVVFVENSSLPANDPTNWSDLILFLAPGQASPTPGGYEPYITIISAGNEAAGITNSDMSQAGGPSVSAIVGFPNTVYLPENSTYQAVNPSDGTTWEYQVQSTEPPVSTEAKTWGSVKAHYH